MITKPQLKPRPRVASALMPGPLPERLQKALNAGKAELAQPFRGITTDGNPIPGLYPLRRTGVSLEPVNDAANAFLASLTPDQKDAAAFAIDSAAWRSWQNMHPFMLRHGICLEYLTHDQREAALRLLHASLSASGYLTARGVMQLNQYCGEITQRRDEYGEWFYWISVMGEPSANEPWGWQIDGHHLIINCFVVGDQIVLTPQFLGSEPVSATSGKYAGTRVFEAEETQGFELMAALASEQQNKARIGMDLPSDVLATAFRDNLQMAYQGIRYDELSDGQRHLLVDLIRVYTGRLRPGHASIRNEDVMRHITETHFAWVGPSDSHSPFYYRIQSPVILIEFDHQPSRAFEHDAPYRDHVHTVVRTPNGNDYGQDLLRQHYEQHDHSHPNTSHRLGRT